MKPGNDLGRAGLRLFAAVCELVCELDLLSSSVNGLHSCCFSHSECLLPRDFQRPSPTKRFGTVGGSLRLTSCPSLDRWSGRTPGRCPLHVPLG